MNVRYAFRLTLAAIVGLVAYAASASAQIVIIQNRWTEGLVAGTANGAGLAQADDGASTRWEIGSLPGSEQVNLRHAISGAYLFVAGDGSLQIGGADPNAAEARWIRQVVDGQFQRLQSAARQDLFVHNQNGPLQTGAIEPGWWSAMWAVQPVAVAGTPGAPPAQGPVASSGGLPPPVQNGGQLPPARAGGGFLPPPQGNGGGGLPPPRAGGGPPAAPAGNVQLIVQNHSGRALDVFVDDGNGGQIYVHTIGPDQQLTQPTPVGYFWTIAQDDQWKATYRISTAPVQFVSYPEGQ